MPHKHKWSAPVIANVRASIGSDTYAIISCEVCGEIQKVKL